MEEREAREHERIQSLRAAQRVAEVAAAQPILHAPEPQADGTVRCCGLRWARHAHGAHLRGEHVAVSCSGVKMIPADEEEAFAAWQEARRNPPAPERPSQENPAWRAEQYQLYLDGEERRRRRAVKVSDEPSTYGW